MEGVYYAKLVPGETKLLGHAGEALAWREPEWTRVVDQLGSSFLRGDAAVDPKYAGEDLRAVRSSLAVPDRRGARRRRAGGRSR